VISDDVGEGVFITDFPPEMVKFSLHLLGPQNLADDGQKLFELVEDGLFEEIISPLLQGFHGHRHRPVRRDENHGDRLLKLFDLRQKVHAAQVRHLFIGNDDVSRLCLQLFERLLSVPDRKGLVPFIAKI